MLVVESDEKLKLVLDFVILCLTRSTTCVTSVSRWFWIGFCKIPLRFVVMELREHGQEKTFGSKSASVEQMKARLKIQVTVAQVTFKKNHTKDSCSSYGASKQFLELDRLLILKLPHSCWPRLFRWSDPQKLLAGQFRLFNAMHNFLFSSALSVELFFQACCWWLCFLVESYEVWHIRGLYC